MGATANPFFSWLAAQPPFVEVALGMLFCVIVAPVMLALVAAALTKLEDNFAALVADVQPGERTSSTPRPAVQQTESPQFLPVTARDLTLVAARRFTTRRT